MDEVAELLATGRHRHGRPVTGLHERAAAKLAEVDAKIADLTTIRAALIAAVGGLRRPDRVRRKCLLSHPFTNRRRVRTLGSRQPPPRLRTALAAASCRLSMVAI
ncbi:MerR family DNA-binding protein [Streptomyces sp. V1I1]|uniref:MerR family DNA-binding protein n=1 Tax=Streptomyces sp. V1I1 TaxID=3042272 RepID=UPI0027D795BD|nr:MerR family DNA-binding protein [Streptomyces sp. V1I1]